MLIFPHLRFLFFYQSSFTVFFLQIANLLFLISIVLLNFIFILSFAKELLNHRSLPYCSFFVYFLVNFGNSWASYSHFISLFQVELIFFLSIRYSFYLDRSQVRFSFSLLLETTWYKYSIFPIRFLIYQESNPVHLFSSAIFIFLCPSSWL